MKFTKDIEETVDIDISIEDLYNWMSWEEQEEMMGLMLDRDPELMSSFHSKQGYIDFNYILSSRELMKEFAYQLKFCNSDNLEFLKEELL